MLVRRGKGGKRREVGMDRWAWQQLEVASTDERLRRATAEVFEAWTEALTERLGERAKALAILAALEGAFVLCRASRSAEPMLAAGEMAAALVAGT